MHMFYLHVRILQFLDHVVEVVVSRVGEHALVERDRNLGRRSRRALEGIVEALQVLMP